jgi:hypothetical protein
MSAVDTVVGRIPNARRFGGGWRAPCPVHGSRGATLSIAEGRDGRVLLRCFAGCDVGAIASSIGIEVRDLFPRTEPVVERPRRAISDSEIREFLVAEVQRQRARRLEQKPFSQPRCISADVNAARLRANLMFATSYAPIARYVWEGYMPHDNDPQWPMLFTRALSDVAWEFYHSKYPGAPAWESSDPPVSLHPLAAARAARWLRAEAPNDFR